MRDRAGNMYWIDRGEKLVLMKRSPDGKNTPCADAQFRQVEWMTVASDGTIFLMDRGDLRGVSSDGKVTTIAARLSANQVPPAGVSDKNYHMGLWTDAYGKVYVAVAQERLVLRVGPDGNSEVAVRPAEPWSPSGGTYDRGGNLWLLEYDTANAVRARRIDREGRDRIFSAEAPRHCGGPGELALAIGPCWVLIECAGFLVH